MQLETGKAKYGLVGNFQAIIRQEGYEYYIILMVTQTPNEPKTGYGGYIEVHITICRDARIELP